MITKTDVDAHVAPQRLDQPSHDVGRAQPMGTSSELHFSCFLCMKIVQLVKETEDLSW
jgi:hypothetical protein